MGRKRILQLKEKVMKTIEVDLKKAIKVTKKMQEKTLSVRPNLM